MTEDRETRDMDKYLKDIAIIKDMLFKAEQKPIYENWAFYAWGGLLILASVVHFLMEKLYFFPIGRLFLEIWLPMILVSSLVEAVTLVRNLARQALAIYSRTVLRFYLSIFGSCGSLTLVVLLLIKLQAISYLPLVFLLAAAIVYFIFAQTTYTHLYVHGFLFIVLAVIFYLFDIPHQALVPIVGCVVGVSQITAGVTEYLTRTRAR
jgi:hypothetical protein